MFKRLFRTNQQSKINHQQSKDFFSSVTSQVDDSSGWQSISARGHDRDYAEIQELYTDALTAWRKNPIAWRIISFISDYVIGSSFKVTSPDPDLARFIQAFWSHPKNYLDLRLVPVRRALPRRRPVRHPAPQPRRRHVLPPLRHQRPDQQDRLARR